MKDKETPLALVRLWAKMTDNRCYQQLDLCRAAKDDGTIQWPDYCILPINAAATYLIYNQDCTEDQAAAGSAELTACYLWRQNKVVYAFDPDLASALADQANDLQDTDVLPADLLFHLPYSCIYIKAPGLLDGMDGFWAWMDYDVNRDGPEFRVQWVFEDMQHSIPQVMHILPGANIHDCVIDTLQTTLEHLKEPVDVSHPAESSRIILSAIQLVLYLLADNADVEDEPSPELRVVNSKRRQKPKPTGIQDKASEIKGKQVGVVIGSAFRRARSASKPSTQSSGTGAAKRPHLRRGHWHHYWRGKKDNRELILHWTAPTMIHPDSGDDTAVVLYPVTKE